MADEKSRIENRIDIQAYIQDLYIDLFLNENPVDALKKDIRKLTFGFSTGSEDLV